MKWQPDDIGLVLTTIALLVAAWQTYEAKAESEAILPENRLCARRGTTDD